MPANTTTSSANGTAAGAAKKPVVEPPTTLKLLVIGTRLSLSNSCRTLREEVRMDRTVHVSMVEYGEPGQ